jgi:ADP-ribosyl-[dinitrogen reductase] hydrolase
LLADVLSRALREASKSDVLYRSGPEMFASASIRSIARGDYQLKAEAKIHGTGYVVRSLEAALWCFCQTDSFEQAILKAANLGDDADTTAAICGQVAGAFYGEEGIPPGWLDLLMLRDEMRGLADALRSKGAFKPKA